MNIQPGQLASLVLSSAVQAAVYLVTRPVETLYLDRQPLVDSRETISLTLIFTAPDHYFPCESTLSTTTTLNLSSPKEPHPTLLIFGSGLWPTPPATSLVSPVNCQQNIRPRCHHFNSHIHHSYPPQPPPPPPLVVVILLSERRRAIGEKCYKT